MSFSDRLFDPLEAGAMTDSQGGVSFVRLRT
jgi:hypothetical protein